MCNWCPTSLYVSMPVFWCLFQTLVMSKLTVMLRTLQLDLLDFSIFFDYSVQFLFSWHFAVRSPPRNIDWLDTSASTGCGKKSNLFVGPISPIRPPTKKRHQNHHKSKERGAVAWVGPSKPAEHILAALLQVHTRLINVIIVITIIIITIVIVERKSIARTAKAAKLKLR